LLSPLRLKDRLFYGWVVVVTFLFVGATIWGIRLSFGVFFKSIEEEFSLSRATTSTIFSIYMVLGGLFTVLGGWALDRYGPKIVILSMGLLTGFGLLLTSQTNSLWQLFITYSVLLAMGTSAIYTATMSTVSRWFDKKRGLALGIASSGTGLGTVVMAPLATFLISSLDWRMAYAVMGVIAWLIVIPLSRLLKKDPHEIGALPDGLKSVSGNTSVQELKNEQGNLQSADLSLLQAFRTRSFWLFMFVWLFFASSLFLILTHFVPHVTDIGFSATEAAAIYSLMGGMTIAGRVLMGTLSDRVGRKESAIICALLLAGAIVWLAWSHDLWMLYLFAAVSGFAHGGMGPTVAALIGDYLGLRNIGAILGVLDVGFGAGAAIGSAIGGLIFDITGSYFLAFLIAASAMVVVILLIVLVRRETGKGISYGDKYI